MKFSKFNLIVNNKLGQHFIFNTLNGNCLEVKKNIVELVSGNKVKSLDCSLLNEFTRLGLIVDDFIDENRIFKYFHNREKFRSDAVMSTVLLSWACNLKCVYCFEGNNEGINMNLEQADQYIKFMENLAIEKSAKRMAICLFGGEPLVNFKIGVYILKTLKSFCEENSMIFTCSIITNGTLLNEDVIERLIKFNCNMVQITLDGIQEIHDSRRMFKDGSGSFDKIIESLGLLNSKKIYYTLL